MAIIIFFLFWPQRCLGQEPIAFGNSVELDREIIIEFTNY